MSNILKLFKSIFTIMLPIFVFILIINVIVGVMISILCIKSNVYNNKNEVIQSFRNCINELNVLVDNIYKDYGEHYRHLTIENKQNKFFDDSLFYDNEIANKIFIDLRINWIYCDFDNNRISFKIETNYSADSIEIYFDSSRFNSYLYNNYNMDDNIISMNNWRVCIYQENPSFGWYTEEICNNWFYAENYAEGFNAMKYIEGDLEAKGDYNKVIDWINKTQSQWYTKHFKNTK